ncbi:MAG TPA: hypothetical protein VN577_07650 [Terriglobales bacterium]|nr:hypothetical protein [Terriglobales bacterium]
MATFTEVKSEEAAYQCRIAVDYDVNAVENHGARLITTGGIYVRLGNGSFLCEDSSQKRIVGFLARGTDMQRVVRHVIELVSGVASLTIMFTQK